MDCGRPALVQAAGWSAAILASGAIAVWLSKSLLGGHAAVAAAMISVLLALAGAGTVAVWGVRRARHLRDMCRYCQGPLTYWPRRSSYTCQGPGDTIICYNYAVDRFYAVRLDEHRIEKLPLWRGAAFYCVRLLGGRLAQEGDVSVYEGSLATLTWRRGLVAVGSGVAAWADARRGCRVVVDAIQG